MSQERFDAIDARLERVMAICDRTADNIEAVSHQIGTLSEGITEIKTGIHELTESSKRQEQNIDRLANLFERDLHELSESSKRQERNIDRLVNLFERDLHGLSETSQRQERNIDRLVGIVENLVQRTV